MRIRNSEIFNAYAKLAIDSGLVSEDELTKTAEKKDKELSNAEILYGHKLGPNNGENLTELAHPDTMVVIPAYDAMNSIVENGQQRQDILTYIALKDPDGHLVQNRYVKAADDLKQTLIRVGFAMDSSKEIELMKMADKYAYDVHESILKKNAAWAIALNLAMMAAPFIIDQLSGAYANHVAKNSNPQNKEKYVQKLKPQIKRNVGKAFGRLGWGLALVTLFNTVKNQLVGSVDLNINENCDRLISNLTELTKESEFDSAINSYIQEIKLIQQKNSYFSNFANTISEVNSPDELAGITKEQAQPINDFFNAIDKFNTESQEFKNLLDHMPLATEDTLTGTETELLLRRMYSGFTGENIKKEVDNNINALLSSLNDYRTALNVQIRQSIHGAQQAIAQSTEQVSEETENKFVDYVGQLELEAQGA